MNDLFARALIAGGGAPEIEVSRRLMEYAKTLKGMEQYCFQAFAESLEVIPTTLAENAGLNPISIVTELRNKHARGELTAGINVKKGTITDILEENVIQPLLVCTSAMELAAETVKMILKIDDLVCFIIRLWIRRSCSHDYLIGSKPIDCSIQILLCNKHNSFIAKHYDHNDCRLSHVYNNSCRIDRLV